MDSSGTDDVAFEYPLWLRMYKSGRFERYIDPTGGFFPPGVDPVTGVKSKDVTISDTVSARLFLPVIGNTDKKLPVLVYFHGGGFFLGSTFSAYYHPYLNSLVAEANVIVVSVEYRLAPENPVPAAYDDCYTGLTWVLSDSDEWIKNHGDLNRVILAGDSAGANIAHNVAMRAGEENLKLDGMVLLFPYFWGSERVEGQRLDAGELKFEWLDNQWPYFCPSAKENGFNDDSRINPMAENAPPLEKLGCGRAMVVVAELDTLCARGKAYAAALQRSKWKGTVEFIEIAGEDHCFDQRDRTSDNAVELRSRVSKFLNT